MFDCQRVTYQKACKIKRLKIEKAEENVQEQGREYLRQVRYSTFICIKYGENSLQYKKSLKSTKKALSRYMNALQTVYDAINFDIKEIM